MKRRPILVLLATTSGLLLTGGGSVSAAPEPGGSGFQAMALNAIAGGMQVSGDGLAGQPPGSAATAVPLSSGQLSRSISHGLASAAWPGSLAANAGSLLLLLGGEPCVPGDDPVAHQPIPVVGGICDTAAPIPQPVLDNYHYLNSPVRAEAGYPTTPHADQGASGAQMTADATADATSAEAWVGGGMTTDGLGFGTVATTINLRADGPTSAVSKATSSVQHVSVAAGVVSIDSVSSTANAKTNGTTSAADGGTTVSGMKVAGVPVTVDGHGVHANGTGPSSDAETAAVQAALTGAGIRMYITAPTKLVKGGSASFHAGSLVIVWDVDQKGPKNDVVISLGGADVSSAATLPYQFVLGTLPGVNTPPGSGTAVPLGTSISGTLSSPGNPSTSPATASSPATEPTIPGTFGLVAVRLGLPLASGWAVLVLFGAAIVAFGGGRLPDRLLAKAASQQCVEGVTRRVE
jgi:hypothetical protein